ncbi:protein METABOLIC NETWORK MODULATOR 1 isoform X2 [Gastrolobium bilobum]|uniref:protein METABOLIC NETWORK MODULATOR 1 isoform X2 n=1 Tax=Gastrolobium bilobum TaxID=150636 RepID=UPI002AB1E332|nr:protein METABOLIC NETWORK MODULATOR 1 isoform X2 [Gastrolobium bilobum]
MDQQNQNNTPDGSGDVPLKRKRGRPRKYPRPDSEESSYILLSQSKKQNPVRVDQTPVPPGFDGVNGNQHLQRGQDHDSNDAMVGQAVSGVIEAVFDAGYLLSVRVGDSDTTLRGLVFKPGRYVPISPENDVAPGVPMIRRNEIPFPSRTTQFQTPPPKERNEQPLNVHRIENLTMNGSPSVSQAPRVAGSTSNLVSSLGKNVPSVAGQTTHQLARGNVVPVVLAPNNFSNGMPVSNQPPQVTTQVSLGSGVIVTKEIPVDGNQALISHTQTSQNMLSSGMQSEVVQHNQSSSNVPKDDAKSVSAPFEQLVTEVVKRIQAPSDAMDTDTDNSKSGDNIVVKDPSSRQEDKVSDMDQPVLIKPLQAVQSYPPENSASAPKPLDYTETGKMAELLQNNKTENHASKAAELGSGNKLDDIRNLGTELEDGGTVQSTKPF